MVFLLFHSLNVFSQPIKKDTSYTVYQTYMKLKKKYPKIKIAKAIASPDLKMEKNIIYKSISSENGSRALHLDIYRPAKQGVYPALVMIHGGGWLSGDKSMEGPMAQQIALNGYVSVAVEYRLSNEAKYPAAVFDIKSAIRWLKVHAKKYGIDTSKVAIEGESAGGQLAALVGMSNSNQIFENLSDRPTCTSTVQAVIDIDGVVDFLAPNSLNNPRKPNSADVLWLGGTFDHIPLIWKQASAAFYVDKHSIPIIFITSSIPRFHAGKDEMMDILHQNGIYTKSYTIPDTPHSFWFFHPWYDLTYKYMLQFLRKVF